MKILVPVVNRTNYTKLKPILLNLKKYEVNVKLMLSSGIVVDRLGDSCSDIIKDKMDVLCKIDCLLMNDSLECMCKTIGLSIVEHSSILKKEKPDILLVVGDRFDMVPSVLCARIMNIPIFHIQGGEKSGSIDDTVRDIITICSSRHYVSTEKSRDRVFEITQSEFVFNFGCPAVEYIKNLDIGDFLDVEKINKKFRKGLNIKPYENYFLVVVHPNTNDCEDINMEVILNAVLSFNYKCIVVYPNIDAFSSVILYSIIDKKDKIFPIKHVKMEDFAKLMGHSKCIIGNSSAGIRESASFKIPAVNIGNRQKFRETNNNTISCNCDYDEIVDSLKKSLFLKLDGNNIYYKENSSKNICNDIVFQGAK